jgi:hypothetical protein
MWHENHVYGHSNVLAGYCGLDPLMPPAIPGVLQHGWNAFDGFTPHLSHLDALQRFVWSRRAERLGRRLSPRVYTAIGAPWLYLLSTLENLESERKAILAPQSTIIYPSHSNEFAPLLLDHENNANFYLELEQGREVTVVLYWTEFEDTGIRKTYENLGLRTITHGRRAFEYSGGTDSFLLNQYQEIIKHDRIVSNKLTTALLYGASLGLQVELAGKSGDIHIPGLNQIARNVFGEIFYDKLAPFLYFGEPANHQEMFSFAMSELGYDCLLDPIQMIELFGWGETKSAEERGTAAFIGHSKATNSLDEF